MAKSNMNFTASLRLNSTQFKKGVSDIQRSLKGLQTSFMSLAGALGLGLSFGRLGQSLMDTATKLSTAKNVLQNVSKEFGEYGQNLEWLKRISNEYGQDLITLVNSFAQFRAAAASSKLSLEQMRDIYESLTRAAGAFHLSADRTNDMMMAVTQMLSKGKVAAEELRRQLGNVLPGAFNLMAQAAYNAGIITENTTAALEDAMKSGKVIAEQVLPAFAKELNEVTSNADFDSLQTSMNRLKNSWTTMVEGANFEGFYKGIIDGAQKVVEFFSKDFWTKILTGGAGIFGSTAVSKWGKKFVAGVKETSTAAQKELHNMYQKIGDLLDDAEDIGLRANHNWASKAVQPWLKDTRTDSALHTLKFREIGGLSKEELNEYKKLVAEWNDTVLKYNKAAKAAGGQKIFSNREVKQIQNYNNELRKTIEVADEAAEDAKVLGQDYTLAAAGVDKFKLSMKELGRTFLSVGKSLAVGAIIAGFTYLVTKIREVVKEYKRIEGIPKAMEDAVNKAGGENNNTLIALTRIKAALEDINKTGGRDTERVQLLKEVNKYLGLTGDKMLTLASDIENDVIDAIDKYIERIKAAAKQQAILAQVQSATSRVLQLEAENEAYREDPNYGKTKTHYVFTGDSASGPVMGAVTGLTNKAGKLQQNIDKNNQEIKQLNDGIDKLLEKADENTLAAIYGGSNTVLTPDDDGGGGGGDDKNKATPQSTLQDYQKELQKLDNQYKAGAILAADYKEQVEKLNQKAFEDLSSFGWDNAIKGLATSADKALAEELKKTATAKLLEGLDDPEEIAEFDKAMKEEAERAYENLKNAWNKYIEYVKKKPVIGSVDDSDGYMYSKRRSKRQTYSEYDTHFIGEELDVWEKYVDDLNNYKQDLEDALKVMTDADSVAQLNNLLDQTIEKLRLAGFVVKDLKTKANIAELERDIEDLRKEGIDGIFNSITALADGTDRLYRAVQSLQQINDKTWQNEDLENFLTGINAIIQAFEVMKTIIEAVQTTSEIFAKIKEKNSAKAIALNTAEIASENAKASAAAGAAAAGAASSTAGIPIVGPALAVAAVASVVAAIMAGMRKFAQGGIVGGNSYSGDHQLVRVNSGEQILTRQQQRTLFDIANGKKSSTGGEVQFKIRGTDLVGVLNNEASRRRG